MTASVLALAPKVIDRADALEVLDSLKAAVEKGEIIAFAVVGLEEDDTTRMWSAAIRGVSRLRMLGGIYTLLHNYTNHDV